MIETKLIEIRDHGTFIPAVAIRCQRARNEHTEQENYLMSRAGYGKDDRLILLTRLDGGTRAEYDAFAWGDRTWHTAHLMLNASWEDIVSGQVVDVEYWLGETISPKLSESVSVFH